MVGMLQIITYLLCVYLVYKGLEILQIGLASNNQNRKLMLVIGLIAFGLSVVLAVIFAGWMESHVISIGEQMKDLPRFN